MREVCAASAQFRQETDSSTSPSFEPNSPRAFLEKLDFTISLADLTSAVIPARRVSHFEDRVSGSSAIEDTPAVVMPGVAGRDLKTYRRPS